ncbi:hypothetical protein ACWDWS_02490 [Streptomyces sp. NPDC003328]
MSNEIVTEDNATHGAVGGMSEPLDLLVFLYWRAGETGFRIVLRDMESLEEYGAYDVQTLGAMPGETLPHSELNRLVSESLGKYTKEGQGWVTDPVSLAAFYSERWGWDWVPERFTAIAGKR